MKVYLNRRRLRRPEAKNEKIQQSDYLTAPTTEILNFFFYEMADNHHLQWRIKKWQRSTP